MDKESKLIFEKYSNSQLTNEAIQIGAAALGAIGAPLLAYVSGKSGVTDYILDVFKKAFGIDIEALLNIPGVNLIKYFEPTGITNWPDVNKYQDLYDQNPTDENLWKLYEAMFYTVPIIGKYAKGLKFLAKGSKELGIFSRIGVVVVRNSLAAALKIPAVRYRVLKIFTARQTINYSRAISSILGVSLSRMLGIRFLATGAVELTNDSKKFIEEFEKNIGSTPYSDEKSTSSQSSAVSPGSSQESPLEIKWSDFSKGSTSYNKGQFINKIFKDNRSNLYYKIIED